MSPDRRPPPEFLSPLPIRKTRAGLQFTCAAPTVSWNSQHLRDVWVCNSDGYVGQVIQNSNLVAISVSNLLFKCSIKITFGKGVYSQLTSGAKCCILQWRL